jgi:hypothetical protein
VKGLGGLSSRHSFSNVGITFLRISIIGTNDYAKSCWFIQSEHSRAFVFPFLSHHFLLLMLDRQALLYFIYFTMLLSELWNAHLSEAHLDPMRGSPAPNFWPVIRRQHDPQHAWTPCEWVFGNSHDETSWNISNSVRCIELRRSQHRRDCGRLAPCMQQPNTSWGVKQLWGSGEENARYKHWTWAYAAIKRKDSESHLGGCDN